MQELKNLVVFTTVTELHSFSKAADKLFLTKSAISKIIFKLEQDLKVTLFHRTTRELALTNEGAIFYEYSKKAIRELNTAKELIHNHQQKIVGTVKISVPVILGKNYISPLLRNLLKEQPELVLYTSFNDKFIDFNQEDIDIAVRTGHILPNNNLSYCKIGNHKMIVCGSQKYFENKGIPMSLDDLQDHDALIYVRDGFIHSWKFLDGQSNIIEIHPKSRFITDNSEVIFESVLAGEGLGWLPSWLAQPYIEKGLLKEVLHTYPSLNFPIHIVWKKSNFLPSRIRLVIDTLKSAHFSYFK